MPDSPPSSSIVLCPGQGAQQPGMGLAWSQQSPAAAETFGQADEQIGLPLSTLCFEGPANKLNQTDIAQAAIYVTSVACFRALAERQQLSPIQAAAGLSLGEFTALHLAGAYDFAAGLRLVRLRGQAMQAAAADVPEGSSMVALVGADEAQAGALCAEAAGDDVLVPANFNCPGQVVISGHQRACDRALEVAGAMGLRAAALEVSGAFHSPLMQPAADQLAAALDETQWHKPNLPVLSNVTGRPHDDDIDSIKQRLIEQLTQPVRWSQSMQWAVEQFDGGFIELAPGKVLSGLMRRIDRKTKVANFAQPPA